MWTRKLTLSNNNDMVLCIRSISCIALEYVIPLKKKQRKNGMPNLCLKCLLHVGLMFAASMPNVCLKCLLHVCKYMPEMIAC